MLQIMDINIEWKEKEVSCLLRKRKKSLKSVQILKREMSKFSQILILMNFKR